MTGCTQLAQVALTGAQVELFFAVSEMPNRFFKEGGKVVDFLGNDWNKRWAAVMERHEQTPFV